MNDNTESTVAVCMATYNPSLYMFKRQIDSILKQTHKNLILIINDDCSNEEIFLEMKKIISDKKRIKMSQNKHNLGFYYNFERCLILVPKEIEYIAFSDQDDFWHENKIQKLMSQFDEETMLVYSDMNIVDDKGKILSKTYWKNRENNFSKLDLLLLANTVTGAAALFKREVLEKAIPFPERIGDSYHDWWIACLSLTLGKIKFISESLYDYYQHEGNVLGQFDKKSSNYRLSQFTDLHYLLKMVQDATNVYLYDFVRIVSVANCIKLRCNNIKPKKKKIINEFSSLEKNPYKLFIHYIKSKFRRKTITLGAERRLLFAYLTVMIYKKYLQIRKKRYILNETRFSEIGEQDINIMIDNIRQKIKPLKIDAKGTKTKINLLIPTIDFNYFFAGYIAKFNFAKKLVDIGYNVRIIIVDWCDFQPEIWKQEIKNYSGLEDIFDKIEIFYAFDRDKELKISKDDVFIATTWWTAHIANEAIKNVTKDKFLYLIQEYEPFTFPHGTYHALASETYQFPHYAIFSTDFLKNYFKKNAIGVFDNKNSDGELNSVFFNNPIVSFNLKEKSLKRKKKKVLYYARPETHASRNMFELGILGISLALEKIELNPDTWEFYGIGAVKEYQDVKLNDKFKMKIIPRTNLDEYKKILPQYDIGISLMYTPHPNLVTLEMASSGMIVITNKFENKTQETLGEISENIIVADPNVSSISEKLLQAIKSVDNIENRLKGSKVKWATNWEEALDENVMNKVTSFIEKK